MLVLAVCVTFAVVLAVEWGHVKIILDNLNPSGNPWEGVLWFIVSLQDQLPPWVTAFVPTSLFVTATGYFNKYTALTTTIPWFVVGILYSFFVGRSIGRQYLGLRRMTRWFLKKVKYMMSFKDASRRSCIKVSIFIIPTPLPFGFNLVLGSMLTDVVC